MYKKEKERIRRGRSPNPEALQQDLVFATSVSVGWSCCYRLGLSDSERNAQNTNCLGFIFTQAQLGMSRYLPWSGEFHTGWCSVVDHRILWESLTSSRMITAVYDVSVVESSMAHQQRLTTFRVLWMAQYFWQGSDHRWVHPSKEEETGPTSRVCLFPNLQHQL